MRRNVYLRKKNRPIMHSLQKRGVNGILDYFAHCIAGKNDDEGEVEMAIIIFTMIEKINGKKVDYYRKFFNPIPGTKVSKNLITLGIGSYIKESRELKINTPDSIFSQCLSSSLRRIKRLKTI